MKCIYDWLDTHDLSGVDALECGPCLFDDTEKLSKYFRRVYAVEANPYAKVPNLPSNVIVSQHALHTYDGHTTFFVDKNPHGVGGASSLYEANSFYLRDYIKVEEKVTVPCKTYKSFVDDAHDSNIQFFWLDMEGFELEFLKSVDLSNIQYIYTEVNFIKFRSNTCLYEELKSYLYSQNFCVEAEWTPQRNWSGDVLFRKK